MKLDGLRDLHLLSEVATGFGALSHDVFQTNKFVFLNSVVDLHTHSHCFWNSCQESFWNVHLEPY